MKLRGKMNALRTDKMRKENDLMRSLKYELNNSNDSHGNGPKECIWECVSFYSGEKAEQMIQGAK